MKLCLLLITIVLILSFQNRSRFDYEAATYVRITSDTDSTKFLAVKYRSIEDSTRFFQKWYYKKGQLKGTRYLHNERTDGVIKYFYEDGALSYFGKYSEGRFVDTQRYYKPNGKLENMVVFSKSGKLISFATFKE